MINPSGNMSLGHLCTPGARLATRVPPLPAGAWQLPNRPSMSR